MSDSGSVEGNELLLEELISILSKSLALAAEGNISHCSKSFSDNDSIGNLHLGQFKSEATYSLPHAKHFTIFSLNLFVDVFSITALVSCPSRIGFAARVKIGSLHFGHFKSEAI